MFKINNLNFRNIEKVKPLTTNNQLERRNLIQDQMSYYRGLKYLNNETRREYEYVESKDENEP